MDDSQRHAIAEYHASDARDILASRLERDSDGERFGNAFGMQGLAATAPRDIGQPSAVQVRTSNPDRV
ncbi:MAG: hypothetical protein IAI49_04150 [Candidatus Eremiobacteraeota bacterium]|nr:hypothetical protein [Candidatus Eremiobacteraeota bacterium]